MRSAFPGCDWPGVDVDADVQFKVIRCMDLGWFGWRLVNLFGLDWSNFRFVGHHCLFDVWHYSGAWLPAAGHTRRRGQGSKKRCGEMVKDIL